MTGNNDNTPNPQPRGQIKQRILGLVPSRIPIAIKLALSITLLIVAGMSLLGLTILENQKTIMSKQVIDMGSTVTEQLADSAREMVLSDDSLGLQTLINNLLNSNHILGATVLSEAGATIVSSGTSPTENKIRLHLNDSKPLQQINYFDWHAHNEDDGLNLTSFISPIYFDKLLAGYTIVTFTKHTMLKSLEDAKNTIIVVTLVMTLVAIILAFVMSRQLSQPIYNLVDASKAIGEGDFYYRLNERRNDEIGELAIAFNDMADGLLKKSQVENVFSRFVSNNVAKKIMENLDDVELGGKHVQASVLFADIVGFTSISETLPPDEIASLLNEYFSYISRISSMYNGHIDKFMGDCAMVVFGVPENDPEHCFNSIACAIMIQKLVKKLNSIRLVNSQLPVHFRIGINTGNMVAGNMGSHDRMEYTVIGDPVNLASRLSTVANSDEIVIMDEFYQRDDIQSRIIAHPNATIRVRGKQRPVSTYTVDDLAAEYTQHMDEQIDQILQEASLS